MRKIYVFYVDVFLLQNFCMDFIAVMGSNLLLKRGKSVIRLFLISFFASLVGLILFLLIDQIMTYQIVTHFLLNTAMVAGCFGCRSRQEFLKAWLSTYIVVLFLGGVIEWMMEQSVFFQNYALQLLGGVGLLAVFLSFLLSVQTYEKNKIPVRIINRGKKLEFMAYYDSGNQLTDPYTGKSVCVLSERKAKELLEPGRDKMRLIPYQSLGKQSGLIWAMDVEQLEFGRGKDHCVIKEAVIGLGEQGFLEGSDYDLLLHAKLLQTMELQSRSLQIKASEMENEREDYHGRSGQKNEKGDKVCI